MFDVGVKKKFFFFFFFFFFRSHYQDDLRRLGGATTLAVPRQRKSLKERRICWRCKGVWGVGCGARFSGECEERNKKKTLLFFDRFQLMMLTSHVVLPHIRSLLFPNK